MYPESVHCIHKFLTRILEMGVKMVYVLKCLIKIGDIIKGWGHLKS